MNKVEAQPTTLPPEIRAIIEDTISRLIAFLDRADAPLEDMEEDDPAGGNVEDEGEQTDEDGPGWAYLVLPEARP